MVFMRRLVASAVPLRSPAILARFGPIGPRARAGALRARAGALRARGARGVHARSTRRAGGACKRVNGNSVGLVAPAP
jgi:hypothetical protein